MTTRLAILGVLLLAAAPAAAGPREGVPITKETWTAAVGFAPDAYPEGFAPGTVVTKDNRAALGAFVPAGLSDWMDRFGLSLRTAPYRPMHPSAGYVEATAAHSAGVAVTEPPAKDYRTKAVSGYVAGLPFPDPRTGIEVAYDAAYAYVGDDARLWFDALWITAKRGVWRTEEWVWESLNRAMHRTDLDPKPGVGFLAKDGVQYASVAYARSPADKRGTAAMYYRFEKPVDQQGWAWVQGMRRDLKLLFGVPGVAWNNSDMLWEDIRGYSGHPEWYRWTLAGKATILAPMHAGTTYGAKARNLTVDVKGEPHWNPDLLWEPRPVYVLEGVPKMNTGLSPHPYGKVVMYVDAESFLVPLKVAYDRKGNLLKVVLHAWNESPDPDRLPPPLALALAVDLKHASATAFLPRTSESNLGLPAGDFTEGRLRGLGQ